MAADNSQFGIEATAAPYVEAASETAQGARPASEQAAFTPEMQAQLREVLLRANPRAVPELIQGRTQQEMIDSVQVAEAAYHRVHAQIQAATPTTAGGGVRSETVAAPGSMTAGDAVRSRMAPLTLISLGLAANPAIGTIEHHGLGRVNIVGKQ